MPSERTFYKSTFRVTVLTEDPYDPRKLRQIADDIMTGPHVGTWTTEKVKKLTAAETVAALVDMGSEPEFFFLNAAAENTADYDPDAFDGGPEAVNRRRIAAGMTPGDPLAAGGGGS